MSPPSPKGVMSHEAVLDDVFIVDEAGNFIVDELDRALTSGTQERTLFGARGKSHLFEATATIKGRRPSGFIES